MVNVHGHVLSSGFSLEFCSIPSRAHLGALSCLSLKATVDCQAIGMMALEEKPHVFTKLIIFRHFTLSDMRNTVLGEHLLLVKTSQCVGSLSFKSSYYMVIPLSK